jgi:hypothetical protein
MDRLCKTFELLDTGGRWAIYKGGDVDEQLLKQLIGPSNLTLAAVKWLFRLALTEECDNDYEDVFDVIVAADYFLLREDCSTYTKFCNHLNYTNISTSKLLLLAERVQIQYLRPLLLSHGCLVVSKTNAEFGGSWLNLRLMRTLLSNYPQFNTMQFTLNDNFDPTLLQEILTHQPHLKTLTIISVHSRGGIKERIVKDENMIVHEEEHEEELKKHSFGDHLKYLTIHVPQKMKNLLEKLSPNAPLIHIKLSMMAFNINDFLPICRILKQYSKTLKYVDISEKNIINDWYWIVKALEVSLEDAVLETFIADQVPFIKLNKQELRFLHGNTVHSNMVEYWKDAHSEFPKLEVARNLPIVCLKEMLMQKRQFIELKLDMSSKKKSIELMTLIVNSQTNLKKLSIKGGFKDGQQTLPYLFMILEKNQLESFQFEIGHLEPLDELFDDFDAVRDLWDNEDASIRLGALYGQLWSTLQRTQPNLKTLCVEIVNIPSSVTKYQHLFSMLEKMMYLESFSIYWEPDHEFINVQESIELLNKLKSLKHIKYFFLGEKYIVDLNDKIVMNALGTLLKHHWSSLRDLTIHISIDPDTDYQNNLMELMSYLVPPKHTVIPCNTVLEYITENVPTIELFGTRDIYNDIEGSESLSVCKQIHMKCWRN